MILRDENGTEWECIEVIGGPGAAVGDRGGQVFRKLQFRRVNGPASPSHEIIISTELDLNDPAIQQWVLRRGRKPD